METGPVVNEEYSWAIVIGGSPDIPTLYGCKGNNEELEQGIWIYSRRKVMDTSLVNSVFTRAEKKGLDVYLLKRVDHEDCLYV